MDQHLLKCLESKHNTPFDLPMTIGGTGPKIDAFRGVSIIGTFSAVPLDARNLQRISYGGANNLAELGLD